jgi:DNA-binding HxlR family transcriptional regulator
MATKRTYGDLCGVARALDSVGERWALLVVRELLLGPKRFTDLRAGLPHVSPDILSLRLRELEASGVVRRRRLPPPAGSRVYELTERGAALRPVVLELGRWGSVAPFPAGEPRIGADAIAIALLTLFDRGAALEATFELRLGEDVFVVRVGPGVVDVARGAAGAPDAVLETDPGMLAAMLWHGLSPAEAERAGAARVEGDRSALERLLLLFPLPADGADPAA